MEEIKTEQKESVKLIKNSKGYNWEIKIHFDSLDDKMTIGRLKELDEQMRRIYSDA